MKTVTRSVFSCDFCGRYRLTPHAIVKHEPRCIYNPDRSVCGWHDPSRRKLAQVVRPAELVPGFVADPDVDALREKLGGCPACMLAVVVQARQAGLHPEEAYAFDYKQEVERFRSDERDEWDQADLEQVSSTWL